MLIKLLKYELKKKWKALRYVILGYLLLQIMLLFLTRSIFWAGDYAKIFTQDGGDLKGVGAPYVLTMFLYFGLAVFIGLFSIFEAINRFGKDLSGKQAVLELMLPIISWKKIVSKILVNLSCNFVFIGLSAFSIVMFILININFEKEVVNWILNCITQIVQSPGRTILVSVYVLFYFSSLYAVSFCCIAFSKSISNKSKISIPVGLASLACFIAVGAFVNTLLIEVFPIINYNFLGQKESFSSNIMSVIIFLGALYGTSWLVENKIEF